MGRRVMAKKECEITPRDLRILTGVIWRPSKDKVATVRARATAAQEARRRRSVRTRTHPVVRASSCDRRRTRIVGRPFRSGRSTPTGPRLYDEDLLQEQVLHSNREPEPHLRLLANCRSTRRLLAPSSSARSRRSKLLRPRRTQTRDCLEMG